MSGSVRDLPADEYERRLAELTHPAPTPAPVPQLPKHAREMTGAEFDAAVRDLATNQ
jgi:hypothetical protein